MLKMVEKGSGANGVGEGVDESAMAERNAQLGRELEAERREKMELAA